MQMYTIILTHRSSELKHIRVCLSAASRGYISALPQWDGALPHGRRFVAFIVKVLKAHDTFNGGAVQDKPTPVPFL